MCPLRMYQELGKSPLPKIEIFRSSLRFAALTFYHSTILGTRDELNLVTDSPIVLRYAAYYGYEIRFNFSGELIIVFRRDQDVFEQVKKAGQLSTQQLLLFALQSPQNELEESKSVKTLKPGWTASESVKQHSLIFGLINSAGVKETTVYRLP